ncbi:hypothetical protein [Bosea sp. UC22_33]|uniref:hypothetical protein n=1 Tax=Bosea sp. UC22_33 TaxID=3350165 RepID=UPI00366AE099
MITGIKPRLPQELVLHREHYAADAVQGAAERYDAAIQDFQGEQNIPRVPWSRQALARVAGPQSLSGRDRIQAALAKLGFLLK